MKPMTILCIVQTKAKQVYTEKAKSQEKNGIGDKSFGTKIAFTIFFGKDSIILPRKRKKSGET